MAGKKTRVTDNGLDSEMKELRELLDERRHAQITMLRQRGFGSPVTLRLSYGEMRGRLRECDESNVSLIGGRTVSVDQVREVLFG